MPDANVCLQGALGLTLSEAENVFAKIIVKDGRLSGDDVHEVFAEKQQIIRRAGCWNTMPPAKRFPTWVGWQCSRIGCLKRAVAFTEPGPRIRPARPKGRAAPGVQGCGKSLCAKAVSSLLAASIVAV